MTGIGLSDVTVRHELLLVRDYNLKRRMVKTVRPGRRERPDHVLALDGVSLHVEPGTRLGVMGANGAGKSTLLSVMAGLLAPTSGRVWIDGTVLPLLGGSGAGLDYEATGASNVIELGILLGESKHAMESRLDEIAEFSGLGERFFSPVYTYSSGMAARLRFSVITVLRPDILLMDEGMGTADAAFSLRARDRLRDFFDAAGILVMASHSAGALRAQCTEGLWLHEGRVMLRGPIQEVSAQYDAFATGKEVPG